MVITISSGAALLAFIAFLTSRLIGGVIGEYGKRVWFSWIEPHLKRPMLWLIKKLPRFQRAAKIAEAVGAAEQEVQRLTAFAERLLIEREELQRQIIKYRVLANRKTAA